MFGCYQREIFDKVLSASEEDALIGKDEILSGDLELLHGCRSWIKSWDNCTMSYFVRG
jgi:hypothetical protein